MLAWYCIYKTNFLSYNSLERVEKLVENLVYQTVRDLVSDIENTQTENIEKVAAAIADTIENGGIIQAFGSGHSNAGALEITHRAGGFIPTKNIKEPAGGAYETVLDVGKVFMKKVDIRENDLVFIVSMSGRNPLSIDVALEAMAKWAKTVAVTSVSASRELSSKHESRKNLYEVCDYVLDTKVMSGDASIDVEGLDGKVCGMSSIGTNVVLQATMYRAVEILLERGINPPIYKSQNIEGGREYNEALEEKYLNRLYRI